MDTCLKVLSILTGIQIVLWLKCGIHQQLKSVSVSSAFEYITNLYVFLTFFISNSSRLRRKTTSRIQPHGCYLAQKRYQIRFQNHLQLSLQNWDYYHAIERYISFDIRAVLENNLLSEQYVQCIWDKDTDEMVWWPPAIEDCTSKYYKEMLSAFTKLLFPLSKYNAGTSHILKVSLYVR